MSWYSNYIENISQSNESFYREYAQEWVNNFFDDTTLLRTIKEQKYPFTDEYVDYEVHIDSVAEITVNIDKVIGDFISVIFKDCEHQNYRGQKYLYDGSTYLCYDKINYLTKIAKSNLIRCNNEIVWLDDNGNILKEDVFLGYELTSTNDSVNKDGIVSNRRLMLYMQCNEKTKNIKINQRFMFQHNQCFRVEEIDNYNRESKTNNDVTMMKVFLVYSTLLPTDNVELNICDYNKVDYDLKIDQDDISQIKGFSGKLTTTVLNNDKVIDPTLIWESDNDDIATINSQGEYVINGEVGDIATIKCSMLGNPNISDSIKIIVVDDYLPNKVIVINPNNVSTLRQKESIDFVCGVFIEGEKQSDIIICNVIGDESKYMLQETVDGFRLTNLGSSKNPMVLKFNAVGCDEVEMSIKFIGLI